jgi:hypothetical protein
LVVIFFVDKNLDEYAPAIIPKEPNSCPFAASFVMKAINIKAIINAKQKLVFNTIKFILIQF